MRITRTAALAAGLIAVGAAVAGLLWSTHQQECARYGCPSGQATGFAGTVSVTGYTRLDDYSDGHSIRRVYVGSSDRDVMRAVTAAGVSLRPPQYPDNETDEHLVAIGDSTIARWRGCGLLVSRVLPAGLAKYQDKVPAERLRDVRDGTEAVILVDAVCD